VIAAHDHAAFEIVCYANGRTEDALTARLRAHADLWRPIAGKPDDEVAALIEADGIDILVDLSGHTAKNRLPLFARRPAPLQLTWLGYFGTTGLEAIDHILADHFVIGNGEERFHAERVHRLEGCYLCWEPHPIEVAVGPPPSVGNGFVTFGCFNNLSKLSPETIALWQRLLLALPDARLFLKSRSLGDAATRNRIEARFAEAGIAPERLRLEGHAPLAEAMACYNEIDIALDPFPFGGGTTTAETLWMGVPLVTMRGERWTGRMSQSMLCAIGHADWVSDSQDDYLARAIAWAEDPAFLAEARRTLRQDLLASPFCDGKAFAKKLEAAFRTLWDEKPS